MDKNSSCDLIGFPNAVCVIIIAGSIRGCQYDTWSAGQENIRSFLKKNQNALRPSEHPPLGGEKCQNV